MPDPRFFLTNAPLQIGDALRIAGAECVGTPDTTACITRAADLAETDLDRAAVYVDDAKRAARLGGRRFGLCLAPHDAAPEIEGVVAITRDPRAAFAVLAGALHALKPLEGEKSPFIDKTARIHATAVIGSGAEIGGGAFIGPYAVIGPGVVIGAGTIVEEHASIWCALVGARGRIGAGAAIGGPGFGFSAGKQGMARIPQLGRVVIGDEVEIGAQCCVDRGALADTVLGDGVKIDNLVQIGHNVRIGKGCILAAQVGVAGSAVLGDRVECGGQAGIADHLTIGNDARIAAKAGVISDIPAGETWGGYPARPMRIWLREVATTRRRKKAKDNGD